MFIVPKVALPVTRTYNNIGLDHFTALTKQTLAYFFQSRFQAKYVQIQY